MAKTYRFLKGVTYGRDKLEGLKRPWGISLVGFLLSLKGANCGRQYMSAPKQRHYCTGGRP